MAALDRSWEALTDPGAALDFLVGGQRFTPTPRQPGFGLSTAWWLAELSRWIYCRSGNRIAHLRDTGLREILYRDEGGTCCSLIEGAGSAADPFDVLVFRGTQGLRNFLTDFQPFPKTWTMGGKVHRGFGRALDKVWDALELVLADRKRPVLFTGHSLGGALATLAASRHAPTALYSFGSPRVGDEDFVSTLAAVPAYRVVHHQDLVPHLPPSQAPIRFRHVGLPYYLDGAGRLAQEPPPGSHPRESLSPRALLELWTERQASRDIPAPLSDHAPVNYVRRLEALLENGQNTDQ